MRLCAVSVDLDEVHHYLAIHGLTEVEANRHAIYDVAVPRLLAWARRNALPLTLFAVGSDLHRGENRRVLREAVDGGHEIGNHSHEHAYAMTRRSKQAVLDDVARASKLIEEATGYSPRGFRAPGYTITQAVYEVLDELGFLYSSSVFPCPPYYAAKLSAIALKRVLGRRSSSILDDPRVLAAPTEPYRVGRPYWKRGVGLLELPIQTTPWLRLPYIGTTLTLAGARGSAWLTRQVLGRPLVNLELHGIDVLGRDDGLAALAPHQYDVRVPVGAKVEALDAAVSTLKGARYRFTTLNEVALGFDSSVQGGQNGASS